MKSLLRLGVLALLATVTAMAESAWSPIEVAVGPQEFPEGDVVTITEVRSDSPTLEVGSQVIVRGRYSLLSEERARVGLSLTCTESRQPIPIQPGSGREIARGTGEFELSYRVTQIGCLRVAFNHVKPGPSFGTVYFGTPAQLARVRRGVAGWVKLPARPE